MFSQNRQGTWGPIPRKTSWMTRSPCRCRYGYGGLRMESLGTDGDVLKSYKKNINYRPWWCTTQKANIDIQNRHICKGVTFSKPSFSKILECKLWPPGRSCCKRKNCKLFNRLTCTRTPVRQNLAKLWGLIVYFNVYICVQSKGC